MFRCLWLVVIKMPAFCWHLWILLSATRVLIPLFLEDWGLLPSVFRRSHIAHYAPAVSFTRRLPESSMTLGTPLFLEDWGLLPSVFRRSQIARYAPAASLI